MKTRLLTGNNQAANELLATTERMVRFIMIAVMLALGGWTAHAAGPVVGPVLVTPASVTIMEDTDTNITIGLSDSAVSIITVTTSAKSSNTNLVSNLSLTIGGVGTNRVLAITPRLHQSGTATITVIAADSQPARTTNIINLTVTFTNYPPTFNKSILNLTRNENAAPTNLAFIVTDIQTVASNLTVTATASNPDLVREDYYGNLTITGTGTNRLLNLTQVSDAFGTSLIELVVTDDYGDSTTNDFTLTVLPVNQPPTAAMATNVLVYNENYGPVTYADFFANVSSGPDNQSYETNYFVIRYTTNFFTQAPSLDANYDLQFQVKPNLFGTNTITFILYNNGSTTNGGIISLTNTVTLRVPFVNQPPSYTLATNLVLVAEETGGYTNVHFIPHLSVGPTNQNGQKWGFVAYTDTSSAGDALFTNLPAVATNGTLTFRPQTHSYGTNTITLVMTNTGGTANGGVNAFTNTFQIGVIQTNHAPVIAVATNLVVLENSNLTVSINVWDYDQLSTNLTLTVLPTNLNLVTATMIATNVTTPTNTVFPVKFTPGVNQFGTNIIRLIATEGRFATTNEITLGVIHVTQAPSFTLTATNFQILEDTGASTNKGIISSLSVGPTNQNGETWTFLAVAITNTAANALLTAQPTVSTNGTLIFKPVAHSYGTNYVTLTMTTSGSTNNGGINTFTTNFFIGVIQTNHAPVIAYGTNVNTLENGIAITNLVNVSSYDQKTNMVLTATSLSNTLATVSIIATNASVVTLTNYGAASNLVFTVVITPLTNSFGAAPIQLVATEGALSATNRLPATITHVNQAPSYTLADKFAITNAVGTNGIATNYLAVALADSGAVTVPGLISKLSVGPANESGETWAFTTFTGTNNATNVLFTTLPAVATNGTLTFTSLAHSYGTNTVTLVMTDNGGTANGGVNAFTNTFEIGIIQTNHAPVFASLTNHTELENGAPVTNLVKVWSFDGVTNLSLTATSLSNNVATVGIVATNYGSGQLTNFGVASNATFTVIVTPVTNAFGSAAIQLVANEAGVNLFTTNAQLTLTLQRVTQPPSFTFATNTLLAWEESGVVTNKAFLQNINVGPTNSPNNHNQSGLTWTFAATATTGYATNVAFAIPPYIATNGTLYFQPMAHSYGTNLVTVVMTTSGATTNGGVNATTNTFYLGVVQTNHAPTIIGANSRTVLENGAPVTTSINVWDYDSPSTNKLTLTASSPSNSLVSVSIISTNLVNASNILYTVVYTPVTNASGVAPIQLVASETGGLSTTNNLTLTVIFVTVPPSFTPSTNLLLAPEESPAVTNTGFLTGITVGPLNESGETWTFTVNTATNNPATNAAFAVLPTLATNGTLIFQPRAHSYGTNTVTVVMTDSGTSTNGGVNSFTNSFQIGIYQINHAPVIAGAADQTVIEGGAPATAVINVWDYDLQVSNLNLTANLPNGSLASVTILATNIVSASNVLYTVAFAGTNTSGAIPVQFVAGENIQGNSLFTTNQVNLNVIFINQAPSFTVSTPFVQALEESPMVTNSAFLTSISVGPANQSGQTWTFTTVTDTNELATVSTNVFYTNAFFSVMPYITTNGTLYFAPQAHSYGTNSVTVVMTTSGSPTNGGVNSCTNHFLIGIIQTNHAPVIACPTQETLTEDGAPVTAVVNVWDYDFQSANLTLGATSLSNLATVSITGTNIASASNVLYTVVFTPGNNKFGTNVIQFVASEGALTSTNTLMLVINYVNQAPSFNINTNFITAGATTPNLVLALEESSLVTNAWFLTNILVCPPGQLGQGGQTWTFTTLTDTNEPNTNAFFAVAPYITTNGTLIFEPLPHSYGTNAVTVTMTTTGSTANGGHNSYTTNFFIGIIETNHAPVIVADDITMDENGAPQSIMVNVWDYDQDAANLVLTVTPQNALVGVAITYTNDWTSSNTFFQVTFTPTNGSLSGSTVIQLVATESDFSLLTTNYVTATVNFVNQGPTNTLSTNLLIFVENSGTYTIPNFVTNISVGANQGGETWGFVTSLATGGTNAVYATLPTVATNGTLTLQTPVNSYGSNTVTLVMTNSGGTANGGINVLTNTFSVIIEQTNHAPTILASTVAATENGGAVSNSIMIYNFDQDTNMNLTAAALSVAQAVVSIASTNLSTTNILGTVVSNAIYEVVYTPGTNVYGAIPIKLVATETDSGLSNIVFMTLNVGFVNQAPSYTLSATNVLVLEESPAVTNAGFLTGINVGPAIQSGETWTFTTTTVTNFAATNAQFAIMPYVQTNGTLIFQPLAHSYGTNPVMVVMTSSGPATNGGVNVFTNTFTISVQLTNHAPVLTNDTALTVVESGAPVTGQVSVWDYDSPSTNLLSLTVSALSNSLVTATITATNLVSATNALYTVSYAGTNTSGVIPIQLVATESGSGLSTTNTLTLTVTYVNQPPTFTPTTNLVQVLEESPGVTNVAYLTGISPGPANQDGETWSFTTLTATNSAVTNAQFAITPFVHDNGTLIFQPQAHSYGTNLVTVTMTTTGPTNNGGINSYTTNFYIGVIQTNHAPVFANATNLATFENVSLTNVLNVWDYDVPSSNLVLVAKVATNFATVSLTHTNATPGTNVSFTLVITPTTNVFGTNSIQLIATEVTDGPGQTPLSTTNYLPLTINYVNQAPSFTPATNLLLALEESPVLTNTAFLSGISVGPTNQNGQTWTFTTTTYTNGPDTNSFSFTGNINTNAMFAVMPWVDGSGTLVFQPMAHSYGTNLVTVVMTTSGTTNNGGVNTYTNTFQLGIIQTNHAPVIASTNSLAVSENAAPITTTISVSDNYDQLSSSLVASTVVTNSLATVSFLNTNVVNASNTVFTVLITPAADTFGTNTIQLIASQPGFGSGQSTLSTTNFLTLNVAYINQAPTFTPPASPVLALEESYGITDPNILTGISVGAPDQSGQSWTFTALTATNNATNALFTVLPLFNTNGTLLFEPRPHSYGTNTVTVVMTTSGSKANGGVNSYTNSFVLGIIQTNHFPVLSSAASQTFNENGSPVTNTVSVADNYDQHASALTLAVVANPTNLETVAITGTNVVNGSNVNFTVVITPNTTNGLGTDTIQWVATQPAFGAGQTALSTTNLETLIILQANQPPTCNLNTNLVNPNHLVLVLEDSGVITDVNFGTNMSVGPAIQSGETWGFSLLTATNNATNAMFTILPAMSTNGTLTFQPMPLTFGTNLVTLTMTNSGGTANGGNNTYTTNFYLGIIQTNHYPVIVGSTSTNLTAFENVSLTNIVNVWDYDQSSNLTLVATSGDTNLATVQIIATNVVSASNTLFTVVYTPANDALGTNIISLTAGQPAVGAGQSTLTTATNLFLLITFVNQEPSFTLSSNLVVAAEESAGTTNPGFVSAFNVGPNQSGQTWYFTALATTNNATNALFAVSPYVSTNGTLVFQPLAHSYGTNPVTLTMTTSGSTNYGGVITYTTNFNIGISQIAHAPVIANAANLTVLENGSLTNTYNVWDYDLQSANLNLVATSLNPNNITNLSVSVTATNVGGLSNAIFTVVFTPSNNVFGSNLVQLVASEGTLKTTNLLLVTIAHVNLAPSFSLASNTVVVAENSGVSTNTGFVTALSVGPANQSGETWAFTVLSPTNNAGNAAYAQAPTIATNGTLTFNPGSYSFGTNTLTIIMTTSGTTANGGVNTATNTLTLKVTQVPYAPAFAGLTNTTILENATNATLPFTLFDPLSTNFNVSCSSSNSSLVGVSVSGTGRFQTLAFTPVTNLNGSSVITVTADDGTLTNSTNFLLTVAFVNQAPSFTLMLTNVNVTAYNLAVSSPWAVTNILAGPPNQSTETVSFVVTNNNTSLFAIPPTVDASGTLHFTPGTQSGVVTVGVRAVNSGGTANGGVNTSPAQTFTITIPVNPFQYLAGPFMGLFYDTNTAGNDTSGLFALMLTNDATFTGYVLCAGVSNTFAGRFSITNDQAVVVAPDFLLNLSIDTSLAWTESIGGSVSNSLYGWLEPVTSYLDGYSASAPTPLAGDYNLALPGFEDPTIGPAGFSVLSLTISAGGAVAWTGFMADNTPVSGTSVLSSGNLCPLYSPLYANGAGGSLIGWLSFNGDLDNNVTTNSVLTWFDAADFSLFYTGGFTNQAVPQVNLYDNTLGGDLSFSSGIVILTGGNLTIPITNSVAISDNIIYVDPSATDGLYLTNNPTTGVIQGFFVAPGNLTNSLEGVILQNSTNVVNGYFMGSSEGGSFILFGD